MPGDLLTGTVTNIANFIAAAGGLGTAAFGLVDASKAVAGGMSNPGFGYVRKAVEALVVDAGAGRLVFGKAQVLGTLRANWLNGVSKADQKAIAKSFIRLGLTPGNARQLATATGGDPVELTRVAERVRNGQALTPEDVNILGRFDAVVSANLDLGYERADQLYRNAAKIAAALIALVLAAIGGGVIYFNHSATPTLGAYLSSNQFVLALLVGVVATPLAPAAKDLSSALTAAVKAVGAVRR